MYTQQYEAMCDVMSVILLLHMVIIFLPHQKTKTKKSNDKKSIEMENQTNLQLLQ